MIRRLSLALALTLAAAGLSAADNTVEYTIYGPYFESNKSGLTGKSSHLVITLPGQFDRIFGSGRVMKKKPNLLPKGFFDKNMVIAVIKRGDQLYDYKVSKVEATNGVLEVEYTATAKGKPGGTARFASPLIIGVPRGKYRAVQFKEGARKGPGTEVHTVKIEK